MLTRTFYPTAYRSGSFVRPRAAELRQLENGIDRLFGRGLLRSAEYPPINAWGNGDEVFVEAELPGYDAANIDISVVQSTLTLRGERQPVELKEGETYHRRERPTGRFVRTIEIPFEVENDQVEAEYKDGILTVRLPRAEAHRPKKIAVKAS